MTQEADDAMVTAGRKALAAWLADASKFDVRVALADVWRAMSAAAPQPAPSPTPTPTPTGAPWASPPTGGMHPYSAALCAYLWNRGSDRPGNLNFMRTYPVYTASDSLPMYRVSCTRGNLNDVSIRFGSTWPQPTHSDRQMIVHSPDRATVVELYDVTVDHAGKALRATRADRIPADLIQHPPSRGVGIPYHHMLITDAEVASGEIRHALSMRVGNPHCTQAWYPASKVEGTTGCANDGIPEGARFLLRTTQARVDAWAAGLRSKHTALERFGRAVARALNDYGFFITDNGAGYAAFDVQHPTSWASTNPLKSFATNSWTPVQDCLDGLIRAEDLVLCEEIGPRLRA